LSEVHAEVGKRKASAAERLEMLSKKMTQLHGHMSTFSDSKGTFSLGNHDSMSAEARDLVRRAWLLMMFRAMCWRRCHEYEATDDDPVSSQYWRSKQDIYIG